jgi:hypothetical protein
VELIFQPSGGAIAGPSRWKAGIGIGKIMVVPWKVYECQPEVENPVNDDYHRCLD